MNLRRLILAFSGLSLIGMLFLAPLASALTSDLDLSDFTTTSDETQGDVQSTDCANLDESIAGIAGCDTTDKIGDFTDFQGSMDEPDATGYDSRLTQNTNAREFIQSIVNFALSFLGIVAVVIIIYGGGLYVTSRGDEEATSKGKKAITYAAIGIVIILGSYAFVNTILSAGGGDSNDLGNGTDTNGTTITEAGAAFDVDGTLSEIEDITAAYKETYDTYLENSQEIAYLNSIEMPLIVNVDESNYTLNGLLEAAAEWISGTDPTSDSSEKWTDEYTLISQEQIDNYVSELKKGLKNIQANADPYSETYERAQALYDYLISGTTQKSDITSMLVPTAKAFTKEDLAKSYSAGTYTGDSCTVKEYADNGDDGSSTMGNYREIGLGVNVYNTDVNQIDDNICPLIADIQTAADNDYTQAVNDEVNRMVALGALFDSQEKGFSSGSSLSQIRNGSSGTFDAALAKLTAASTTVKASTVRDIITSMNDLHSSIKNLEFVQVILQASSTSANAPAIVRFNALGTEDPSGETVQESSIQWDLDGDGSFDVQTLGGNSDKEPTGSAVSITYKEAGTYRARVRVLSSSPNVAAGISTVTIKVNPPRSLIVLDATVGSETSHIADFTKFPNISADSYKVTLAEGNAGISFDASKTTDGDSNADGILLYAWDFGDNFTCSGGKSEECGATVIHSYGEAGTYTVSLTVTDSTGVQDNKYFTLYVASPAARISTSAESGVVGSTFTFDSSGSSVDVGQIVSRQWSATLNGKAVTLGSSTGISIDQAFDAPGIYTITLTVADNSNKTDTASINILVESTPPVATFDYSIPNENQPATLLLDATNSHDPDEGDTISYEWNFDGTEGTDYKILEMSTRGDTVKIQYLKAADYEVVLTVKDSQIGELQKSDTARTVIQIDTVLDVDLTVEGSDAKQLSKEGTVDVSLTAESQNATSFEIDYGDNTGDYSEEIKSGKVKFTHTYETAGIFYATLKALDDDGNENEITRRVYVGSGDSPIAVVDVSADGEDIGFGDSLTGNSNTQFLFDGSASINTDGTNGNLSYSWNFGDGTTSTKSSVTHTFKEHRSYDVTLTVTSKKDKKLSSETSVEILIEGLAPQINGITITPAGSSLTTPLKVNVSVDATDRDGKINYIKAWYYDVDDSGTELGTLTSQSTSFTMTLNTKGEEGEERKYAFAAEVYDNDNKSVSSEEELSQDEIPTLTVVNGPNDNPVAGFTVDKNSVYIGDEVNFSSTSYDPDGKIVAYRWDVEGDGFSDNTPQTTGSYTYTFKEVHPDGVKVRLQVEDDMGATTNSDAVTIYVDSNTEPPEARFLTYVDGTSMQFVDNSKIDTQNGAELVSRSWDFDLSKDSDGNGEPDDDTDSEEEKPTHNYKSFGTYEAKLTIKDSSGQSDSVTQDVTLQETKDPVAAFTVSVKEKTATFTNNSTVDAANNVDVRSYNWDFDLDKDSNGDGNSENDADSTLKNPTNTYKDYGNYQAKLTVEDSYGKTSSVTQTVNVSNPLEAVTALLTSTPQANSLNQIVLSTDGAEVTFNFSAEGGSKSYSYSIDKNIFSDSNGDGVRDNDPDYTAKSSGSWKTSFYKAYGQTVTKLTVTDNETGEKDIVTLQVVFEGSLGSANLLNATPSQIILLVFGALLAATLGVVMAFRSKL